MVGNYASPYTPGTAYVLLHHVFGEVNGKKGVWGHAIGGMGAISDAMAKRRPRRRRRHRDRRAGARGASSKKGRAAGVILEDGRAIRAGAVAANVNPKLLYDAHRAERRPRGRFLPPAWRAGAAAQAPSA